MLTGKAKTDYQREYMRKRRLGGKLLDPVVRPLTITSGEVGLHAYIEPSIRIGMKEGTGIAYLDADGNAVYEE